MKFALVLLLALVLKSAPASAHMMSMSTGDAVVTGNHLEYTLRLPLYEIPQVPDPTRAIFDHILFSSGGQPGRAINRECHVDQPSASFICAAYYEFPVPVEQLDVNCTLHSVTVPNHVHLLRAEKSGKNDQAIFDYSFSHASLRFRPPTALDIAAAQIGGGVMRALSGWVELLFLLALALAARSRREWLLIVAMFLAGQTATALLVPGTGWQFNARFVEAAAALTVAYLAVEILFLPAAGLRWLIAAVLGAFHGLYFHLFLLESGFRPGYVLAGAALAEILVTLLFALAFTALRRHAPALRTTPVAATVLLAVGMGWFFLRLRN